MSARWLASVALYALAVMLMAPGVYGFVGVYFWIWGIPWPSQAWGDSMISGVWACFAVGALIACVSYILRKD